jgi:DNA-directed RNA polymerase subunit RPC12/RpoP
MTLEVDNTVEVDNKIEVGSKIDGFCGRCKSLLRHTIETMSSGEKIGRVRCNTCKGRHLYRAQAPRTRGAAAAMTQERKYELLLRGRTDAHSTPYSSSQRFQIGQLVSHAAFGLGVVTGARDNVKIDICFADGAKVLQQGC